MPGTVSDSNVRIQDMEGTLTFTSIGGGAGAGKEAVTFFQGANSASRKVTASSAAGFTVDMNYSPETQFRTRTAADDEDRDDISPRRFHARRTPRDQVMAKIYLSDGQDINSVGLSLVIGGNGVRMYSRLFDDGSAPHRYIGQYPATESWIIVPMWTAGWVDPNGVGGLGGATTQNNTLWNTGGSGAILGTVFNEFGGVAGLTSGAAKSENLFVDSVDMSIGLYIIGGTESPDDPATFQDFVDYDEGTINNRIGHVTTKEGVLYVFGRLVIGRTGENSSPTNSPQPCYFKDENRVLVFPEHRANPWFSGIEVDITDPAVNAQWNNCVMTSRGFGIRTMAYDSTNGVNPSGVSPSANRILIDGGIPSKLQNGDMLEAIPGSGDTAIGGLGLTSSDQKFHYAMSIDNINDTLQLKMCGDAGNANWLNAVNSVAGFEETLTAKTASPGKPHYLRFWNDTRPDLFLTKGGSPSGSFTINGGTYENWKVWELLPEATVNDASVIGLTRLEQNGATLSGVTFTAPFIVKTYDENSNFTGLTTDRQAFLISDDPSKISNCIFNFLDPESNEGHAIEITVPGTYTFTGNTFPGGWGADGSNTAMIYNTSGGLVTLNVTGGGDSPTVKNEVTSPETTTVINNNVNVTITNLQPDTEVRVYLAEDFNSPIDTNEIAGIEDVASPTEFSFSTAAGTVVDIVIHNIQYTLPPNNRIKNFTVPTTDTSFPVTQLLDVNFRNP